MRYLYKAAKNTCQKVIDDTVHDEELVRNHIVEAQDPQDTVGQTYTTDNATVEVEEDVILWNCMFESVNVKIKKGSRLYQCHIRGNKSDQHESTVEIGENSKLVLVKLCVDQAALGDNCQMVRVLVSDGPYANKPTLSIGANSTILLTDLKASLSIDLGEGTVMAGADYVLKTLKAGNDLLVFPYEQLLNGTSWPGRDDYGKAIVSRGIQFIFGDRVNQLMALHCRTCRLSDEASVIEESSGYTLTHSRVMLETLRVGRRGTLQRLQYNESVDPAGVGAPCNITVGEGSLLLVNYAFDGNQHKSRKGRVKSIRVKPQSSLLW